MTAEQLQYYVLGLIAPAMGITLAILVIVTALGSLISIALATVIYTTSPEGLSPNKGVNSVVSGIVNVLRAIPVIIFIVLLMPLSRTITGSGIGVAAAVVCLMVVIPPYTTRVFEKNLRDVPASVIEAGLSMGLTKSQVLFNIIFRNAIPSMVQSSVFVAFLTLSATTMLGAIGIKGVGNIAILYGYENFNDFIMITCIVLIILIILCIYWLGNTVYKRIR